MSTELRNDAKLQITRALQERGYSPYASLLQPFDIYLTDDPNVIGYMIPSKAKIVLNKYLSESQVSTLVRHEIMHEYLIHAQRADRLYKSDPSLIQDHDLSNIAADYEISNKMYTDSDKSIARAIRLGDKTLRGLVTEDEYPNWTEMSFEDMYRELAKQEKEQQQKLQPLIDAISELNQQDLDDLSQQMDDASQQSSGNRSSSANNQSSSSSNQSQRSDSNNKTSNSKTIDKLSKELDKQKDKLDDIESRGSSDGPFDSDKDQRDKADVARRVKEIQDAFNKARQEKSLDAANAEGKRRERETKEIRNAQRLAKDPLHKFKINLDKFIDEQTSEEMESSYRKFHPSYEDQGFIVPYDVEVDDYNMPIINVYWDVSGSFSSPEKTEGARKAIGTLNKYVRDDLIEMHPYYFAEIVTDDPAKAGGGTSGEAVYDHIAATKPTNVIIISDSDINQSHPLLKVPGAIWYLFFDADAPLFVESVRGKKQTKSYLITNY